MKDKNIHIIHQYLNHEVSIDEVKKQLSKKEFLEWEATLESIQHLPETNFNCEKEYDLLLQMRDENTKTSGNFRYLKVAAVLILIIATTFFTTNYISSDSNMTNISSVEVQKDYIKLPDNSQVRLNASSNISYNKESWAEERTLRLEGEAFFDVEEGETFLVETENGTVKVLGTTFNVKSRGDSFAVTCFSGSVKVNFSGKEIILKPGETIDNSNAQVVNTSYTSPDWMNDRSRFENTELVEVVKDIEIQKNVEIKLDVSESVYFTGAYTYDMNTSEILDLICKSLDLSYKEIGNSSYEINEQEKL